MGHGEIDGSHQHWNENPSLTTTALMLAYLEEYDFVLHIGDISYAVGYLAQWDEFHAQIEPLSARVPWMTCVGNHERDFPNSGSFFNGTDSGGECGVPYYARFPMPTESPDHHWYSFERGPIHFLLMSTEHDFQPGSLQYDFLARDLAAVNRSVTPWVVVSGHRPMYIDSTYTGTPDSDVAVSKLMKSSLESLFAANKVDVCLWGHNHSYQRSCPVVNDTCAGFDSVSGEALAPVHVVIGMAGQLLMPESSLINPQPAWAVKVDVNNYGYTTITANGTHLSMAYFLNRDSSMADQFTLVHPLA
jgi:acid phosphatase type 7